MRGTGKGTGSRGFQQHPRGDKYIDNFDGIFRPSTASNSDDNKLVKSLEEEEEDEDSAHGLEGFSILF